MRADAAQAYIWASIAAIQGNAIALELRNKVMARHRPAEIERADTEVNTWLAPEWPAVMAAVPDRTLCRRPLLG